MKRSSGTPVKGKEPTGESLSKDLRDLTVSRTAKNDQKELMQIPISRKGYSASGREIEVLVNTFPILKFPTRPIYQYEVLALLSLPQRLV